ncbi:class B sortase [Enterococcus hulanensis]|uniref:class B sortase n=1 Tax=Enterococcus hulanensis TaxID=2559929 RepID=UPI0010F9417F|nr:class B sortase [Enterococcus hulanensis]
MKRLTFFVLLLGFLGFCWFKFTDFEKTLSENKEGGEVFHSNKDVYAYLKVDGTNIDYPVAQHPEDDAYYLSHDFDNNETVYGAVFTERFNKKDFNDFATIIYGHATRDGSMFGTLELFSDRAFFDKNTSIMIRTAQETILYEVFAAYSYTDEHLYHTFHLDNKESYKNYLGKIKEISAQLNGNYRDIALNENDKLLILSTCDAEKEGRRFVVHARERERSPV